MIFDTFSLICLILGILLGLLALLGYLKERRDDAKNWHMPNVRPRPVMRDEYGKPLMYMDYDNRAFLRLGAG